MKILGRVAQKGVQLKALRVLTLGACLGVFALSSQYSFGNIEHSNLLLLTSVVLVFLSALLFVYSLASEFPDEAATLSPHILLPNSIARKGLNTEEEPIVFWVPNSTIRNIALIATEKRIIQINQSDFGETDWKLLLAALPDEKRGSPKSARGPLCTLIMIYGLFCALIHFLFQHLPATSQVTAFKLISQGAYNPDLFKLGEIYRVLSYSWLHANSLHLGMNLIALLLIAQTIGNSFSNVTLSVVIIFTAILSGLVGSFLQSFDLIVGASGTVMGLFGFLYAAQRNKDKRLHPFFRIAGQKMLYFVLFAELALAIRFSWYGGSIHLAGIATGYGLYLLSTNIRIKLKHHAWKNSLQLCVLGGGVFLSLSWLVQSYQNHSDPSSLAQKAITTNSAFLTLSASAAIPDFETATLDDIINTRQRAIDRSKTDPIFAWPAARADYWLGNHESALLALRKLTAEYPDSDQLRNLWLAVERDSAKEHKLEQPLKILPAGTGVAYIMSADYDHLARLKLKSESAPIEDALISKPQKSWHLITITAPLDDFEPGTYGVWPIPKTQFRTAASINIAEGPTD